MSDRIQAGQAPLPVEVEAGRTYFWCTCGRSTKQPFCDGSHKVTDLAPLAWTAPETRTVWFCTCKATKGEPLCDGSHKALIAPARD